MEEIEFDAPNIKTTRETILSEKISDNQYYIRKLTRDEYNSELKKIENFDNIQVYTSDWGNVANLVSSLVAQNFIDETVNYNRQDYHLYTIIIIYTKL